MRSSGIGDHGWRPIVGVLAIGLIAFGLSLQGAPAGEDDRPQIDRTAVVNGTTAPVEVAASASDAETEVGEELAPFVPAQGPPKVDISTLPRGETPRLPEDAQVRIVGQPMEVEISRVEETDVVPDEYIMGLGNQGRCTLGDCTDQVAIGGNCDCDIQCDDQLNCNGVERCVGGVCVEGDPAIPNDTTGCIEAVDVPGGVIPGGRGNRSRCNLTGTACVDDGDCTATQVCDTGAGFCRRACDQFPADNCTDAQACLSVTCTSDYCTDTFAAGQRDFCFAAIPHCTLAATIGEGGGNGECSVANQVALCPSNVCIDLAGLGYADTPAGGGICKCTSDAHCANGDCNERSGLCRPTGYECDFTVNDGTCDLVVGSCCRPGGGGIPFCEGGLDIVQCNALGGTWFSELQGSDNNTDPGETGCLNNCPRYSSGIRYPENENSGGGSDPLNPDGTPTIDFGPVTAVPCSNNGFLRIGDDYDLAGGSYIALERFTWTGGSDDGNSAVFEFREFDPPYAIVTELRVAGIPTGRGTFTIGSRENPLSQAMRQAIIPDKGWVVMRSPTFEADGTVDANQHWFSHDGTAEVGTNDGTLMWVNEAPVNQTGGSANVLRFEIAGVPLLRPFDACCTESGGAGVCSDSTEPWDCKVCSVSGDTCFEDEHCWFCTGDVGVCNNGDACSLAGQDCSSGPCRERLCYEDDQCKLFDGAATCNTSQTCGTNTYQGQMDPCQEDNDCDSSPGMGDGICTIMANALATAGDEFPPSGYCNVDCDPDPCGDGACCQADGDCSIEVSSVACTGIGGTWQGFGSSCDPNCCTSNADTSGEFCWQATPHVLVVPATITSDPTVVTITTTTDKATLPGDIEVLGSGPISGRCEHLSCLNLNDPPASWSRTRCLTNADCTGGETCQHQPCSWDDELGGDFACAPGICQSDGTTRCRTAGDCPEGVQGDNCLNREVCERLDCGDPNTPGLGWVVTGQDDVRWEAFTLAECGRVTLDHCCTDDNPNAANGTSDFGLGVIFQGCEGSPSRPMHCNGLAQTDNPTSPVCTTDADCTAGTCTTGGSCNSDNDCALGTCSVGGADCRQDGDCASGVCNGAGTCGGGTECQPVRDKCGPSPTQFFPDPNSSQSQFGWFCADGNPAVQYELPAGTYYIPIQALQTCTTGGPCNSDGDCLNAGTCQIRQHEYQLHITTEKCPESACCRLGPICEFTDPEIPANRCTDPTAGTCSVAGTPCSVDSECPQGTCGDSLWPCNVDPNDCPIGETCSGGVCIGTSAACSTDADCPAGAQCNGAERCVFDDCGQFVCSDGPNGAPVTCADNSECTLGTCSGPGPETCHDDFDCPVGTCSLPNAGKACRVKEDCPGANSQCFLVAGQGKAPETCTGGATCDPQACVDVPLCDVTDRPNCEDVLDGYFSEGAAVCDPPGTDPFENVCFKGACCTDDTEGSPCKDSTTEPGDCVGDLTCGDFGPEGCGSYPGASVFVPGAICADDPCPVCEFEDEAHCQILDLQITFIARCDSFVSQDFRCADDFRAAETGILDRICWWPAFAPPAGSPECSDPGQAPSDNYKLRIYPDFGNVPDEGNEITTPGGQDLLIDITSPVFGRIWQYSAAVDGPQVLIDAGECYWIEVNGIGNATCNIFWGQANKGNDYSMQDFNLPDYPHYTTEDAGNTDLAWCLSVAIVQNPPLDAGCDATVLGGCCLCPEIGTADPATCVINTQDECGTLSDPNGGVGKWKIRNKCTSSDFICTLNIDGTDNCPVGQGPCIPDTTQCTPNPCEGFPTNDACEDAITITHPGGDPANVITTFYNVFCSDSEPPSTNCAVGGGDLSFGVWFAYTAPVCGTIRVESCNSTPIFDGFGAGYLNSDCATIAASPNSDTACNDDGCGAGGPWSYEIDMQANDDVLLRVGSWWDGDPANIPRARDSGFFELTMSEGGDHCGGAVVPPLPAPYPHDRKKNRYFSFDPDKAGNSGARATNIGFQVTLDAIGMGSCSGPESAPCRYAQGTGLNEPGNADCRRCSMNNLPCISASVDCVPNTQACNVSGETCSNDDPAVGGSNVGKVWWVGPEDNAGNDRFLLVSEAFREVRPVGDWPDVIHVTDCEVVPQATYAVRTWDAVGDTLSDPLLVETTDRPANGVFAWWGDAVGNKEGYCNGGDITAQACVTGANCTIDPGPCVLAWNYPNGFTNVDDVLSAIDLFTATGGSVIGPNPGGAVPVNPGRPDLTWVDVHGNDGGPETTDPPQSRANIADVSAILSAFSGRPYSFSDPADCPDTADWP